MTEDPWARLVIARRDHALAIAERDLLTPGAPGYPAAVHRVGVTWSQLKAWERRVAEQRQRASQPEDPAPHAASRHDSG